MMPRRKFAAVLGALLVALLLSGVAVVLRHVIWRTSTITAYFSTATGIYPGDDVRVAGIKVGRIVAIQPKGQQVELIMSVDHAVPIPADAKAVIVAPNLVAARYVQLTPAYESTGPRMPDGAVIPVERTAIPVEWDDVKAQLMRLATELGPTSDVSTTAVGRFIDSAANALGGNGAKLRQTIRQLAGVGRTLAEGSGNIAETIGNLQTFVTALRDSGQQLVLFQNRLATLSSVLNDNRSNLDAALKDLSVAVGDVQSFVARNRDQASEQIERLADVTQNLADHSMDLQNILHVAPNAFANGYNIYNPDTGAVSGAFVLNNFSNPLQFICSAIGAIENVTAPETAKLCAEYLGPALRQMNFNYLPVPFDPVLRKSANPDKIIYSEPNLAPGGAGPKADPAELPPAISAYTGLNGDTSAPPGYGQPPAVAPGPTAPDHLPAYPSPAKFPGAPLPTVSNLQDMLLPADRPSP
ncbi:MCE family protein [Mycobacterium sp. SMC-2]|uniref:MCE family protein n=1 Tax=Mycobacterium sp. SMC-2 TaxID=2857058 RepID=UPI0021B1E0C9|nr:MCE family protein [Mycobacterium sp. SMC-2]UXA06155.1 MCE family protein [Mycobacterium sp. SMC-2]